MIKNAKKAALDAYEEFGSSWIGFIGVSLGLLLVVLLFAAAVVGTALGLWWIMWQIWMYVVPVIAATSPLGFQKPDFGIFIGCFLIAAWVRKFIRGFYAPFKKVKDED